MGKRVQMTPFRMSQVMKTASAAMEAITNGKYLGYATREECLLVVGIIHDALEKGENLEGQEGW